VNKVNERLLFEKLRRMPEYRTPVTFLGCPEALRIIKYERIDVSLIAPTDPELHNGVRVGVIDQSSVNDFKRRIEAGSYDPFIEEPPCVTLLSKNHKLYKKGYRYQKSDGHHRVEAHIQLGIDMIEVAIVEFLPARGEKAEFWRIAFMIEKNDPKKGRFHRKASTNEDLEQAQSLLLAHASIPEITVKKNDENDAALRKIAEAEERAKNYANLMGMTAVSKIRDIKNSILRAANDPDVDKHLVHYYTEHYWKKHITELCTEHNIDSDNLLVRPYYRMDDDCSRDDYTQFIRLIRAGMENVDNLKYMAFLGEVKDCPLDVDVYATRRRKSRLVENMINFIREMNEWLSNERNRKAIQAVQMYWLTQTFTETKKLGTGYAGPVDPITGQVAVIKKSKRKKGK
jgi:hypothetical protein